MVSSNKAQVHEIYAQVDKLANSLVRAVPDATILSPAAEDAVRALVEYTLSPDLCPLSEY